MVYIYEIGIILKSETIGIMVKFSNRRSLYASCWSYSDKFLFQSQVRVLRCHSFPAALMVAVSRYETPRLVTVRSARIGIIYRIVQALIISYLIGYVYIYTKSYQEFDHAESSVVTKIKGLMYARGPEGRTDIWDSIDFVVPAQESDAFFIATSFIRTVNQTQGVCPEDPSIGKEGVICETNSDCQKGLPTPGGNGRRTGKCVDRTVNRPGEPTKTCEVEAWCPTEADETPRKPVLYGIDSVTVLVKNHVAFPIHNVKLRNILDEDEKYLHSCRYDNHTNKQCPIFRIQDILIEAGEDVANISIRGGIIGFSITWNCNLDFEEKYCIPRYSFRRLDDQNAKIAKGWNFRQAYYYYDQHGVARRDLLKLWGIRFVFNVNGTAGKFSYLRFMLNLGSGVGLLGIASVVCEFVLLNCDCICCVRATTKQDLLDQKFTNLEEIRVQRRQSETTLNTIRPILTNGRSRSPSESPWSHHNHIYCNNDYISQNPTPMALRRPPPPAPLLPPLALIDDV